LFIFHAENLMKGVVDFFSILRRDFDTGLGKKSLQVAKIAGHIKSLHINKTIRDIDIILTHYYNLRWWKEARGFPVSG
jgi:hypothetical protein